MNDEVKFMIANIKDKKLRNELIQLIKLTERIEEIEKIHKNSIKIVEQLSKLESMLSRIIYEELSDSEKEKLTQNIKKIIEILNKMLQKLNKTKQENLKQPPNIQQHIDNIQKAVNNLLNTLPPELKKSLTEQLQKLQANMSNLNQPMLGTTPQQKSLPEILKQIKDTLNEYKNQIDKSVQKETRQLIDEIEKKLSEGKNVEPEKIIKLSNNLNDVKKQTPQEISNVMEKLSDDLIKSYISDNIEKVQNEFEKIKNNPRLKNDKIVKDIEKFLNNPNMNNIPKLIDNINKSKIPLDTKQQLNNSLNNIHKTLKGYKQQLLRNTLKNIRNALSNINKATNQIPFTDKKQLDEIKKLLNQTMFNPKPETLKQALDNISKLQNNTNQHNPNLQQAQNNIKKALNNSSKIKNLNNLMKSPQNQMSQKGNSMIPQLGNSENQGRPIPGQGGQSLNHNFSSTQIGMGSFGEPSSIMSTLQTAMDNLISNLQEQLNSIQSELNSSQFSGSQIPTSSSGQNTSTGGLMPGGKSGHQSMTPQQIKNAIQSAMNNLSSGNVSSNTINQLMNTLQSLLNTPGLSPQLMNSINNAVKTLQNINGLNNLMSSMMPEVNSVKSLLSQTISQFSQHLPQTHMGNQSGNANVHQESGESDEKIKPFDGFPNQELIDMLNKLSNMNLTHSQKSKLTKYIKDILKMATNVAKNINKSSLSMSSQKELSMLNNLANAIKNNLHNLNIDDELIDLAQQFDNALGQDYSHGLSGGMFASNIDKIEKVDLDSALNKLAKMNSKWIKQYKELFEKLITEIIEIKTKEIGYYVNPHGKSIDYRKTVRRTVMNAGIPYIVKKDREKTIGDFIFILDASGSMYDIVKLKEASWSQKDSIERRLSERLSQYQVGLITAYVLGEAIQRHGEGDYKIIVFADKMVDLSNTPLDVMLYLISNPEELNKYIGGGTNLRPTILEIIRNYLNEDMNVVLFTDTGDESVWDTFTLGKLNENAKKVGVFCAGEFFEDTAKAFAKAGIPVFSFNNFEDLFELMKRYYIEDLTPERAVEEVREYLQEKARKGEKIKNILPKSV